MSQTLKPKDYSETLERLADAFEDFFQTYPGLKGAFPAERQPVHTVYGGAHLWQAQTCAKLGESAYSCLTTYAPNAKALAQMLQLSGTDAELELIYERVRSKLKAEPIEDFRIDFEDGYGFRSEQEEDSHAESAALETAKALKSDSLPPFLGIRVKPLTVEFMERSLRTLDIFLTTLLRETGKQLPRHFVVTLPKVQIPAQVAALSNTLTKIEDTLDLPCRSLNLEIMIETTQALFSDRGPGNLLRMVRAADKRCRGAHFGTYDYTAGCNIIARYQTMTNPVCDFAKHVLQVALSGTRVWLSDGATNIIPVVPHKGSGLSPQQLNENATVLQQAWLESHRHISHSLQTGYYQGWDLHPTQLPVRYATVYHFFIVNYATACERLKNFIQQAARANLSGQVFDDAATGQGLLNYFLRALNCGALTLEEVMATGLTLEEIKSKSFATILKMRQSR